MLHSELSFKETKILRYLHSNTSKSTRTTYSFQGQERDDEVSGVGNSYTADFWQYSPRLGRRWNQDPKPNSSISNYACFANNPLIFSDVYGDTIRFHENMTSEQISGYKFAVSILRNSEMFDYYYTELENSQHNFLIDLNRSIKGGGQYDPKDQSVTVKSINSFAILAQELFHAYQWDLGVYQTDKDRSVIETEGDLMTVYVANEVVIGLPGMLSEQSDPGGWADEISEFTGSVTINPTLKQIESSEYDKLFNKAVDKRIEHFKDKGKDYEGYIKPNSGKVPLAIKSVYKGVSDKIQNKDDKNK